MKRNDCEENFLIGNDKIEEAITAFDHEPSESSYHYLMEIIRKRVNEDGHFIIPVHQEKGAVGFEWLSLNNEIYEKPLAAAFTSKEQLQKGRRTDAMSHYIDALFDIVLSNDHFDGIILNPWGEAIVLTRFDLQAIKLINYRFGDGRQVSVFYDAGNDAAQALVMGDEDSAAAFCKGTLDKALKDNVKEVTIPAIEIQNKTAAENPFIVLNSIYSWFDAHMNEIIHITILCSEQQSYERYDAAARVLNSSRAAMKYQDELLRQKLQEAEESVDDCSKNRQFYIIRSTYKASGICKGKGFVVLKGSSISPDITGVMPKAAIDAREACIENGILDENFKLSHDIVLSSPSAAAAFVVGHTVSGPMTWRDANGKTLKDS